MSGKMVDVPSKAVTLDIWATKILAGSSFLPPYRIMDPSLAGEAAIPMIWVSAFSFCQNAAPGITPYQLWRRIMDNISKGKSPKVTEISSGDSVRTSSRIWNLGYQQGYKDGYRNGIYKGLFIMFVIVLGVLLACAFFDPMIQDVRKR
jgi:hypothetical protein